MLRIDNGNLLYGEWDTAVWQQVADTRNLRDGRWHHVAAVKNGTDVVLYVDGVAVTNGMVSTSYGASTTMCIANAGDRTPSTTSLEGLWTQKWHLNATPNFNIKIKRN